MPHNIDYIQVNAAVGVVGSNFASATIPFRFTAPAKWYPKKCFIVSRLNIQNGDGTDIELNDVDKAPAMNLMPGLFQNVRLIKDNEEISSTATYIQEIDTFKNRVLKSDSWLENNGKTNFWQASQQERLNEIASNGQDVNEYYTSRYKPGAAQASTISIVAATGVVSGLLGTTFLTDLAVGDVIQVAGVNGGQFPIRSVTTDIVAAVNPVPLVDIAATALWQRVRRELKPSSQRSDVELIWKPTCGAFDVDELPQGNYILELVAESEEDFQRRAIESIVNNVSAGTTAADIKVTVQKLEFFVAINGDNEKSNMTSVRIDEIRCRKFNIDGITSSESSQQYSINPRTKSIAVAFIDRVAGSNTLRSSSKFKIRPITGNADYPSGEMALSKLVVKYNNQVKPRHTGLPRYAKPQDYVGEMYSETMAYNGAYNNQGIDREGGNESKNKWIERGTYYHWTFANKPEYDRRDLDITYQFAADLDANSAAGLVFNWYENIVSL